MPPLAITIPANGSASTLYIRECRYPNRVKSIPQPKCYTEVASLCFSVLSQYNDEVNIISTPWQIGQIPPAGGLGP